MLCGGVAVLLAEPMVSRPFNRELKFWIAAVSTELLTIKGDVDDDD